MRFKWNFSTIIKSFFFFSKSLRITRALESSLHLNLIQWFDCHRHIVLVPSICHLTPLIVYLLCTRCITIVRYIEVQKSFLLRMHRNLCWRCSRVLIKLLLHINQMSSSASITGHCNISIVSPFWNHRTCQIRFDRRKKEIPDFFFPSFIFKVFIHTWYKLRRRRVLTCTNWTNEFL